MAGRFLVGRRLGVGGTADVFEAKDVRLDRLVAVKVLARSAGDHERAAARFAEEIRLLTRLSHRRLLPLLDAGVDGPNRYLVLPLVPGPTLADRLALGPVSPAEASRIGGALADTLAYLHSRRVVHRDVKPGNVLLGLDGAVHLIDFGAAFAPDSPALTPPNHVVGTAGYLAPEQAQGSPVTPACDVYALGLVLLESLRGQPEYRGSPTERLLAAVHRPPNIPAALGAGWCRVIEALTQRDPDRRPAAAEAVALLAEAAAEATVARAASGIDPAANQAVPSGADGVANQAAGADPAACHRSTGRVARRSRVVAALGRTSRSCG